jgi:hypothetical protein
MVWGSLECVRLRPHTRNSTRRVSGSCCLHVTGQARSHRWVTCFNCLIEDSSLVLSMSAHILLWQAHTCRAVYSRWSMAIYGRCLTHPTSCRVVTRWQGSLFPPGRPVSRPARPPLAQTAGKAAGRCQNRTLTKQADPVAEGKPHRLQLHRRLLCVEVYLRHMLTRRWYICLTHLVSPFQCSPYPGVS